MTRLAPLLTAFALTACQAESLKNDAAPSPEPIVPAEPSNPFAETLNAHPTAPEAAPIPAKFRGIWANTPTACADLGHYSRLVISGQTIRYPDRVISGDAITQPKDNYLTIDGKIEGTDTPASARFSLQSSDHFLRDEGGGGSNRVRCP